MFWCRQDLVCGPSLNDRTFVQDDDAVGELTDGPEIVGDNDGSVDSFAASAQLS